MEWGIVRGKGKGLGKVCGGSERSGKRKSRKGWEWECVEGSSGVGEAGEQNANELISESDQRRTGNPKRDKKNEQHEKSQTNMIKKTGILKKKVIENVPETK